MLRGIIGSIVLVGGFILLFSACQILTSHYSLKGTVVYVEDNVVTVMDKYGDFWEFEGTGFEVDDKVKMKMFDNYTENTILDDEVQKVKKISE